MEDRIHASNRRTAGSLLKKLNVIQLFIVIVKDNIEFFIVAADEFGIHLLLVLLCTPPREALLQGLAAVERWRCSRRPARQPFRFRRRKIRCFISSVAWDSTFELGLVFKSPIQKPRALSSDLMPSRVHRVGALSALMLLALLLCAATVAASAAAAAETWDSLVAAEIEWSTSVASAHMQRLTYLQKLAAAGPSAEGGAGVNAELASVRARPYPCFFCFQACFQFPFFKRLITALPDLCARFPMRSPHSFATLSGASARA